eukprot:CAMPEP_0197612740 /NCGR_PEP_ID=MMETSP1326-20131121/57862_1 /TAXON_ID=1155430 /ORGANISM="Genus nov. species nov., Strain RCC2288" /LENGTH=35 /DNA_ID= /DNA_START= /DNA_END= /DNA_ORIENTATION=
MSKSLVCALVLSLLAMTRPLNSCPVGSKSRAISRA